MSMPLGRYCLSRPFVFSLRHPLEILSRAPISPDAGLFPSLRERRTVVFTSMLQPSGDLFADISQLQDRLDQVFGSRTQGSSIRAVNRAGAFPALNVGTWADALEIYAFAPGIDAKSVQLSVEKGLLSISGERAAIDSEGSGVQVYARERFRGPFRRVVELPDDADPSR